MRNDIIKGGAFAHAASRREAIFRNWEILLPAYLSWTGALGMDFSTTHFSTSVTMAACQSLTVLKMFSLLLLRSSPRTVLALRLCFTRNQNSNRCCNVSFREVKARDISETVRLLSSFAGDDEAKGTSKANSRPSSVDLYMENLYQEWTLEEDKKLLESAMKDKLSIAELAALMGRGIRGVEARLSKLRDVNSQAYQRAFADINSGLISGFNEEKKEKLIPAGEVIRRIKWDFSIPTEEFSILHYDRVDDKIVESSVTAPNEHISGKENFLVDALPEHRIVAIKYRDRIVWDREKRIDRVFSNEGIQNIIATYNEWKSQQDMIIELNRRRQKEVSDNIRCILGFERYDQLKQLSIDLQEAAQDKSLSLKVQTERYVQSALSLFRQARQDPSQSLEASLIPLSDYEALDSMSELVAQLPYADLRPLILQEITLFMNRVEGKKVNVNINSKELPELDEDDLEETFVRGSGPGGQKINKTSNRVVLVHKPTQLRVECQDTRSLPQNRKIARKRMRLKLDEYLNGSQSRENLKALQAAATKSKAKVRSRARQRRKQEANETGESAPRLE